MRTRGAYDIAFRTALRISACGATAALASCGGTVHPTSTGDAPDAAPPTTQLERLCAFDASPGSAKTVLAVRTGTKLLYVRSDGSQLTVLDSLPSSDGGLLANADHVFVSTAYTTGQPPDAAVHQALYDATGAVAWARDELPGTWVSFAKMNGRSIVAEQTQRDDSSGGVLQYGLREIGPGGDARTVDNFYPLAVPGDDGSVQAESLVTAGADAPQIGWLPSDGILRPIPGSWTSASVYSRVVADGTRFVYLDGDSAHLVVETLSDRRTIALPHAVVPSDPTLPAPQLLVRGRWAWIDDIRVDLETPSVQTIAAPPNGLRPFADCPGPQRALEEDGSVLEALRNDSVGSVYRSSDLGKTWTPVGAEAQASVLTQTAYHSTYLVRAGDAYCGEQSWTPLPSGSRPPLTDGVSQVTRPSMNRQRLFTDGPFDPVVTNDGLCVAYTESSPATDGSGGTWYELQVWDLQTDRTMTVVMPSAYGGPFQAAWLETSE
jgi:hypothetical protein